MGMNEEGGAQEFETGGDQPGLQPVSWGSTIGRCTGTLVRVAWSAMACRKLNTLGATGQKSSQLAGREHSLNFGPKECIWLCITLS